MPPDRDWSAFPNPTLVIEVLSPSTARFDCFITRHRFQRADIPEYWVVDVEARAVLPLELPLPALFNTVWGSGLT